MDPSFKQKLHTHCIALLHERAKDLEKTLRSLRQDLQSERKSSAGDKHETGRAMLQLEMEKLGKQLIALQKSQALLQRINSQSPCEKVESGSLFNTNKQWYFVSIGLGPVTLEEKTVFCIAPGAPLAQSVLGKRVGDAASFQGKVLRIEQLF